MSDFASIVDFEGVWRPVARVRSVADRGVLPLLSFDHRARLSRIARRAPEVMVKITGKTYDADHLKAHLRYISREGSLPLEGRDGVIFTGRRELAELGDDWALDDVRRRRDASLSTSLVLSMPPGTPAGPLKDAVRAFAAHAFGERFDYVLALHTDADHPHVHLSVRSLGADGERLNPRKADLDAWRRTFARLLRDRDIEAEATPRRARGVVRRSEAFSVRKLGDRSRQGGGPPPKVWVSALRDAEWTAGRDGAVEAPWDRAIRERSEATRAAYLAMAAELEAGDDATGLAAALRAFVGSMPPPLTRRGALMRDLRDQRDPGGGPQIMERRRDVDPGPDRTRS